MTTIHTLGYSATTWVPRGDGFAYIPARCVCEGDPDALVFDLAAELRSRLWWGSTETVVAVPAAPTGGLDADQAPVAGLVIGLSANQPAPEWADGNDQPDVSAVLLELRQRLTRNLDDLTLLVERRKDVRRVLHRLDGTTIGAP